MHRTGISLLWLGALVVALAAPAGAQLADSPWPTEGGNNARTQVSEYPGVTSVARYWQLVVQDGYTVTTSVSVATDGTLYFGASKFLGQEGGAVGRVYALHPNGTVAGGWPCEVDSAVYGSPTVSADGSVYCGGGFAFIDPPYGEPGALYKISSSGQLLWTFTEWDMAPVYTSPLIDDEGNVYFGTGAAGSYPAYGKLYKIWPASPEPVVRWVVDAPDYGAILASPALSPSGRWVYFGTALGTVVANHGHLYAVNAANSERAPGWPEEPPDIGAWILGAPTVVKSEGVDRDDVFFGSEYSVGNEGRLHWYTYVYTSGQGQLLYRPAQVYNATVSASPAVKLNNGAIVGSEIWLPGPDGVVHKYVVNGDGASWSQAQFYSVGTPLVRGAVVDAGEIVYFDHGDSTPHFSAVRMGDEPGDPSRLWTWVLDSPCTALASIGHFGYGDDDLGNLYVVTGTSVYAFVNGSVDQNGRQDGAVREFISIKNWWHTGWSWPSFPATQWDDPATPDVDESSDAKYFFPEEGDEGILDNNFYWWDPVHKTIVLYPYEFQEAKVGEGYVLNYRKEGFLDTTFKGIVTKGPFDIGIPEQGWIWIGQPHYYDVAQVMLKVTNLETGQTRTAEQDYASGSPWLNWNFIYWDCLERTAKICIFLPGYDDSYIRTWYGYRVWSYARNLALTVPDGQYLPGRGGRNLPGGSGDELDWGNRQEPPWMDDWHWWWKGE